MEKREKISSKDWGKKFLSELKDLLVGAAFPLMLSLILSSTIISYAAYGNGDDLALKIVILSVGEVLLIAATFIFGKQNGKTAYKKTVQNGNKRQAGSTDEASKLYIGEYSLIKGALIPVISCIPFIIFQIIEGAYHNAVCEFALMYAFGWAYFPLKLAGLPQWFNWLNLIWIIPYAGVHLGAYIFGGKTEKKKQDQIAAAEEAKVNNKK